MADDAPPSPPPLPSQFARRSAIPRPHRTLPIVLGWYRSFDDSRISVRPGRRSSPRAPPVRAKQPRIREQTAEFNYQPTKAAKSYRMVALRKTVDQVLETGRRLVYRVLAWRPELPIPFRLDHAVDSS